MCVSVYKYIHIHILKYKESEDKSCSKEALRDIWGLKETWEFGNVWGRKGVRSTSKGSEDMKKTRITERRSRSLRGNRALLWRSHGAMTEELGHYILSMWEKEHTCCSLKIRH